MTKVILPVWENKTAPCAGIGGCPVHTDIAASLHALELKSPKRAWEIMMESHPLRATLGRVCYSFCEEPCNRGSFDEPIAIKTLEAIIGDEGFYAEYRPALAARVGKRVGIIGAGPAGLAAGWFLNIAGFDVTIHESEELPGGMLRYGIPDYRLPKRVLDREIKLIVDSGARIVCSEKVDLTRLDEFKESNRYDGLICAIGAGRERSLEFAGSQTAISGLSILKAINRGDRGALPDFGGKRVVVVGAGNVAMDVSRSALRLGAAEVAIVYRRERAQAPAWPIEMKEAEDEGVQYHFLTNPVEFAGGMVRLELMTLGAPDESGRARPEPTGKYSSIEADYLLIAVGQEPVEKIVPRADRRIWIAGDLSPSSRGTVIHAIADGKRAASELAESFGLAPILKRPTEEVDYEKMNIRRYFHRQMRMKLEHAPIRERIGSFEVVEKIPTLAEGVIEADRCFRCGVCIGGRDTDCDWCFRACVDERIEKKMIDWTRDEALYERDETCDSCGKCWEDCPRYVVTPREVEIDD